jgi:hypothetical protein
VCAYEQSKSRAKSKVQAGKSSALRTKSSKGKEEELTDRRIDEVKEEEEDEEDGEEEEKKEGEDEDEEEDDEGSAEQCEDMGRKERSRKAQLLNRTRQESGGIITAKFCTNCLKDKPLDSYSKAKKALFGRCPHCRLCRSHLEWGAGRDGKLDAHFKSARSSAEEENEEEEEEESPVLSAKAHFLLSSVISAVRSFFFAFSFLPCSVRSLLHALCSLCSALCPLLSALCSLLSRLTVLSL